MEKQKTFYVAIVFGDLEPDAVGGYKVEPEDAENFFLTEPSTEALLNSPELIAKFEVEARASLDALIERLKERQDGIIH